MELLVSRLQHTETETVGVLYIDGRLACMTLEPPWKENKKRISCIPDGMYKITRHMSPRFGDTFLLSDVPNRAEIIIHAGNNYRDTEGCILLGIGPFESDGIYSIGNSRETMSRVRKLWGSAQQGTISIKKRPG